MVKVTNISFNLSEETIRIGREAERKVLSITNSLLPKELPENRVEEAVMQFKNLNYSYFDSKRKARALSCLILNPELIPCIQSDKKLAQFEAIIIKHPSKNIGYYLLLAVLQSWNKQFTKKALIKLTQTYLEINNYNLDSNLFKISKYIFDSKGEENLSNDFAEYNGEILDFLKLIGLPMTAMKSEFTEAIIKRISKTLLYELNSSNNNVKPIYDLCLLHKDSYISKDVQVLLISQLINKVNKVRMLNDDVRTFALDNIGDVSHHHWRLTNGLSSLEIATISSAKNVLQGWMTDLFLDKFWKLIDDPQRRRFWKSYSSKMSDVKIILDIDLYRQLDDSVKVSPYLNRIHLGSNGAVLIFEINSKLFVEFGGYAAGPLQVYKDSGVINSIVKSLTVSSFSKRAPYRYSNNSLKRFTVNDNLMDGNTILRDFGRIPHVGGWQSKLRIWMRTHG